MNDLQRSMKLLELDPQFIKREIRPCHIGAPDCITISEHTEHEYHVPVDNITEADGIIFLCPVCFVANKGDVGTHAIICWRPRVPLDIKPGPGRWEFHGTGLNDLTLTAGSSSIFLTTAECKAHFFITAGEIR